MPDLDITNIFRKLINNNYDTRVGIYIGLFLIIFILSSISYGETINLPLTWTSTSHEIGIGNNQINIHKDDALVYSVDVLNISGNCADLKISHQNGQYFEDYFCEGYQFNFGDWLMMKIDKIIDGSRLKKPIQISSYRISKLNNVFKTLLLIIPVSALCIEVLIRKKSE